MGVTEGLLGVQTLKGLTEGDARSIDYSSYDERSTHLAGAQGLG